MSEDSKSERKVREVEVECFRSYSDNVWTNVGPHHDSLLVSPALAPPHHVSNYVRLPPNTSKGLSYTDVNTFVFLVLEGELTVIITDNKITDNKFTARAGDTFYVPNDHKYDLINQTQQRTELFVIQYKTITN